MKIKENENSQIEDILQKREEEFRLAFENAKDAIFWADTETGIITNCNKAAEKLLEKKKNEIIGYHQTTLHPQQKVDYYSKMFKKHIEDNGAIDNEAEVITKSGKITPVHITASITPVGGKPIIQGIFRDITERKNMEKALEETNERLKYLLTSTSAAIYTSKTSGDYGATSITENVKHMTGYEPEEFIKNSSFWIDHVHPEDKKRILSEAKKIFEKGRYFYEYRFLHKDGTYMWIRDEMKLVRDGAGNPVEIVGYWIDITERKQAEKEMEVLNKKIINSNKKLKQLALKDSHTGLYNHRYLEEVIESEFYRARRTGHPISVIMVDIDYFKSINDVYGHHFGDLVLKQIAKLLKRLVNRYDIVIRFGGEEFIIISPGTDRSTILILANKILDAVKLYNFGDKKHIIKLKISLAVASYPEDKIFNAMDIIKLTDQILSKVKEDGGDRIYSSRDIEKEKIAILEKGEDSPDIKLLKDKIERLTKRANQSLVEAIFAFAKTITLKDYYTGEHVEKTVHYATEISKSLSLLKDEIEDIRKASILHDIGKIGISDKILLKKSKLTKKEYEMIKRHPLIGVDIIRPIKSLYSIIPSILYHHERWDGKGYPTGLKGDEIPISARIIAIADVYQALISKRPYRKAYNKDKVIKIIKEGSGTQFDPKIVRLFLQILEKEK